ncbi:MAG TPA: GNAT family N-acetyltransferase [Alphaproteobacteria bacterium]|jgi:GNAT superfamily N-acetyltransferase|nr:GNAT family N-acetyltransferase [Alphaproteobacteria bacterium]
MSLEDVTIETLAGAGVAPAIPDVARLRIAVFREFPYLYDGNEEYERKYLRKYVDLPESTVVVARAVGGIVGASTALPMVNAGGEVIKPFADAGYDPARIYYFGESVLLREYRGRGLGVAFFERREARARELDFPVVAFCAVDRPQDHPRRPKDYVPLDAFWRKRGYAKRADLRCRFAWKEIGETAASPKCLTFWLKELVHGALEGRQRP